MSHHRQDSEPGRLPIDRRTVLKGTIAAAATGVGTAAFAGQAGADTGRAFVVEQGDSLFCVTALHTGETVEEFYNYIPVHSHTSTDIERSDVSNLLLFTGPNGTSLVALHDKADDAHTHGSDTGGGAVTFDITGLPTGSGQWVVQDDGGDFDSATDTSPDWAWAELHTDGGAWRGGLDGDFSVTIDPAFNEAAERDPLTGSVTEDSRIDEWHLLSGDAGNPERIQLDMNSPVTIQPGECVAIDVKPGSDPNALNPDNSGTIPVAILHTADFDPARVDVSTLRFGDSEDVDTGGGATPAHGGHVEDVDGDGDDDLVVHFPTQDADFEGDETMGKLVGETTDGTPLIGTDSVKLV